MKYLLRVFNPRVVILFILFNICRKEILAQTTITFSTYLSDELMTNVNIPLKGNRTSFGNSRLVLSVSFEYYADDLNYDRKGIACLHHGVVGEWGFSDKNGNIIYLREHEIISLGEPTVNFTLNYNIKFKGVKVANSTVSYTSIRLSELQQLKHECQDIDFNIPDQLINGMTQRQILDYISVDVTTYSFSFDKTALQNALNNYIDNNYPQKKDALDPEIENMLNQLSNEVAKGNMEEAETLKNQILEITKDAYPDKLGEVQRRINLIMDKKKNNSNNNSPKQNPKNSKSKEPSYSSDNDKNDGFPEGWKYLEEYQAILNECIREYNKMLRGADGSSYERASLKLNEWVKKHASIFSKFNNAQMEAFEKIHDYFIEMTAKGLEDAIKEQDFVGEEKSKDATIPNIKSGTTSKSIGTGQGQMEATPNKDGLSPGRVSSEDIQPKKLKRKN